MSSQYAHAQLAITNYVLFSGNGTVPGATSSVPASPGYAVQLFSSTTINGGWIGSNVLVKSTGSSTMTGSIRSGGTVVLANSNTIGGGIVANNNGLQTGTSISVGSSAKISGNINANGNIVVSRGKVFGSVTHPTGTTYTGPTPSLGNIIGTPTLPAIPSLPTPAVFPSAGATNITTTQTITPGSYGNMTLGGSKVVTFAGPGVYVFNSITNTGSSNTLKFNFQNIATGNIKIYVHGKIDLGKSASSIINGGSASRIFYETHSNAATAFNITNGANTSSASRLDGNVYAPYGSIYIGSGTGCSQLYGSLWSGTQVTINCGVTINYVCPAASCTTPNANAGADMVINCNSSTVTLNGSSATSGVTYSWTGPGIVSGANTASPVVNAAGTYTLTVNNSGCTATDQAIVTVNTTAPGANAGADQTITCSNSTVTLSGSSSTSGVNYSWSGPGILSGNNTATATANATGSYTLTVSNPANGCSSTDNVFVSINTSAPSVDAGADQTLTCANTTVTLSGSSLTSGVDYSWSGPGIVSGNNSATATADATGSYTLTVTNPVNGCSSSDEVSVGSNYSAPTADAGPSNAITCSILEVTLSGSTTTQGGSFAWTTSGTGNIVSGANTATPIVNGLGVYTLTVTDPNSGCTASDTLEIYEGPCILPYYTPCPGGKYSGVLGCELSSLFTNYTVGSDTINDVYFFGGDSVYIEIITNEGQTQNVFNLIYNTPGYGLTDTIPNGLNPLIITGRFPIANLGNLATAPVVGMINYVRPVYPSIMNTGVATTQGDQAQNTNSVRSAFNVDGEGVKVCVLSDSYNSIIGSPATTDISNGDLPGAGNPDNHSIPVDLIKEYPYGQRSDEGRAMLQIIHDVAPGASLGFRTGSISEGDMASGIIECANKGCKVIADDITWLTSPFFQDGVIAKAVDSVSAMGVSYVVAAGNFGSKSYEGIYSPMTTPLGLTGTAHDFGGGDNLLSVTLAPGNYTIVLQWQDSIYSLGQTQTGSLTDYDIYLTNQYGTQYFGFNRNNLGGDPLEVLPFIVPGSTPVQANISIIRSAGSLNSHFKLIVFRGEMSFNEHTTGSSTIVGQANAEKAITVGAVNYFNTPAFGVNPPTVQNFSSRGGTTINGVVRSKPDLIAPNGGNTTVQMGGPNVDGDLFPNFFGTSAAAPHAAGAAALMIHAKQKFYGADLLPAEVKSILNTTALDIDAPGYDINTGNGYIQPYAAMMSFAAPTPDAEALAWDTTIVPGTVVFTAGVTGDFFTTQSVIIFNGDTLPTTFINSNQISTTFPTFFGNFPIYVYTPPIVPFINDGGNSDTLYFFSTIKKHVKIVADNKTKKYGEALPAFTASIYVDDVLLENTTLTYADLGLSPIQFTSSATSLSNTGIYFISPSASVVDTGYNTFY
ncbi:MAG TPA: S8 family serine peptidase, partial [Bacteroidia bacterium]|nr:S8 family serine peptidase [Bacteroidia bacterium]